MDEEVSNNEFVQMVQMDSTFLLSRFSIQIMAVEILECMILG